MMKKLMLSGMLLLGTAAMAMADPVAGTWETAEGEDGGFLHVTIAPCGNNICGTISAAYDTDGNPSPDYEHLRKQLIWGMTSDGGGSYSGGKVWAPDSGKTYKSKMTLSGNKLTVKGCVAGGLICRGQDWTRIN